MCVSMRHGAKEVAGATFSEDLDISWQRSMRLLILSMQQGQKLHRKRRGSAAKVRRVLSGKQSGGECSVM